MVNRRITTKSALFILVSLIGTTATVNSAMAQAEFFSNKENLSFGVTSLMSAVVDNDVDGVRFFLKSSDSINQKNMGGATALHIASRTQNAEIARILLENGADVNLVDAEGWTPLMRASLSKSAEIVSLLLLKGAKIETLNNFKDSAIVHAAMSDCNECLDYMITKSDFVKIVDIKTVKSQISRSFAIARSHDNQLGQEILTSGLDAAIKFAAIPSEDTVVINSYKETVTKGLSDPVEIVDLSYDKNKDVEQKPAVVELQQPPVVELEQKQIVELEQKLDNKSDTTLTEKDIPPIVIAKIEYKEATAPAKTKGSKKFKLTQGPSIVKPEIALQEPPVVIVDEYKKEEIQPLDTVIEEPKESRFSAFLNIFRKKEKVVTDFKSEPSNVVEVEQQEVEPKKEIQPLVSEIKEEPKSVVVEKVIDSKSTKKFKFVQGPKGEAKLSDSSRSNVSADETKAKVELLAEVKAEENVAANNKEEESGFFSFLNFFSKTKNADIVEETPKEEVKLFDSSMPNVSADETKAKVELLAEVKAEENVAANNKEEESGFFSFLNFFSKTKNADIVEEAPKEEVKFEKENTSKEVFEKQAQPEINDIQKEVSAEDLKKSDSFFSFLNFFSKKKETPVQEIQNPEPKTPKKFKLSVGKR